MESKKQAQGRGKIVPFAEREKGKIKLKLGKPQIKDFGNGEERRN